MAIGDGYFPGGQHVKSQMAALGRRGSLVREMSALALMGLGGAISEKEWHGWQQRERDREMEAQKEVAEKQKEKERLKAEDLEKERAKEKVKEKEKEESLRHELRRERLKMRKRERQVEGEMEKEMETEREKERELEIEREKEEEKEKKEKERSALKEKEKKQEMEDCEAVRKRESDLLKEERMEKEKEIGRRAAEQHAEHEAVQRELRALRMEKQARDLENLVRKNVERSVAGWREEAVGGAVSGDNRCGYGNGAPSGYVNTNTNANVNANHYHRLHNPLHHPRTYAHSHAHESPSHDPWRAPEQKIIARPFHAYLHSTAPRPAHRRRQDSMSVDGEVDGCRLGSAASGFATEDYGPKGHGVRVHRLGEDMGRYHAVGGGERCAGDRVTERGGWIGGGGGSARGGGWRRDEDVLRTRFEDPSMISGIPRWAVPIQGRTEMWALKCFEDHRIGALRVMGCS